ncbi:peptidase T [Petrotoga sp. 9PWA.NaAc.5.4]|uniref:peptidase T n=1 Tax=Petrotoga sp. 9PWA.NaAc.5.4 TaxID=1434328 RepID=UPI0035117947
MDIVERFKKYIAIDTKSDESSKTVPSTPGQLVLGRLLVQELREMGLTNAKQDEHGYVYATLQSKTQKPVPSIGFIAHMDTSPDLDGKCTNPHIFLYQGGNIILNNDYIMTVEEFPFLDKLKGKEIITTDGTTLLGADNKAGIAAIMNAVQFLVNNPDIEHGNVQIAFTPDEEIGRGTDFFDIEGFGAEFAYTVDGGPLGELEYENFNAASIKLKIYGKNVHPGTAKNVMINALRIALEIESMLPVNEKPEYTEGYEGFFLLTKLNGTVDYAEAEYIIRDHSKAKFEFKKQFFREIVKFLNYKYSRELVKAEITDSYYNMKEKIEPHMEIIELAKKSMIDLSIDPIIKPIRGGTDGARLSYMGLPCPNIFTGGYNFHSRFELIPVEDMKVASDTIVKILENNVKEK